MGEVAPTYFASNEARERLANTIPDAKIVCIFRNPVDRILSLYRLKRAYRELQPHYGTYIHEYRFRWSTVWMIFRRCQLYDFERMRWYTFHHGRQTRLHHGGNCI
jgi:hypothetical protein